MYLARQTEDLGIDSIIVLVKFLKMTQESALQSHVNYCSGSNCFNKIRLCHMCGSRYNCHSIDDFFSLKYYHFEKNFIKDELLISFLDLHLGWELSLENLLGSTVCVSSCLSLIKCLFYVKCRLPKKDH